MRTTLLLFFLLIRRPPRSTLFPTRRSSDLLGDTRIVTLRRVGGRLLIEQPNLRFRADRKSTRLNSSHSQISYAVICLKKKRSTNLAERPQWKNSSHHQTYANC